VGASGGTSGEGFALIIAVWKPADMAETGKRERRFQDSFRAAEDDSGLISFL